MSNPKQEKRQKKLEATVEKSCKKAKANVRVEDMEVINLREQQSHSRQVGQFLKASIPFLKGRLQTDSLQVFTLQEEGADCFYLVQPWSGTIQLQHEFMALIPGKLPSPIALKRGFGGSWSYGDWVGGNGKEEDEIAQRAKDFGRNLYKGKWSGPDIEWNVNLGNAKIKLKWGIQAFPLDEKEYVYLMQMGISPSFGFRFHFDYFIARKLYFQEFVKGLEGNCEVCKPDILFPCKSIIFLLKKDPEKLLAMFAQGEEQ